MRKKQFFRFIFRVFSNYERKFFRLLAKKLRKKMWKLPSACPQEQLVALNFFKKFWTVLEFLQKPSAWFSKFYLRVQSKNCGKNSFFCFLSRTFSNFEQKLFRLSAKKLQKVFKTTYVSRGKVCDLVFSKLSNVSDFLQKHLAWFSKFYLRVQSKNGGRNSFFCFLSRFFFEFWAKTFQTFGQKTSKRFQNYLRVQRNSL